MLEKEAALTQPPEVQGALHRLGRADIGEECVVLPVGGLHESPFSLRTRRMPSTMLTSF